ncbi:hypothetical protein [Burkholderia cenocepacia]|uniref:hypothetical protein n=1 Tax=Burkholderia cenocepacia TaxID=95486 RepID=UPI00223186D7|nr:hypothetical protein [Burkholderia cenocepacia]MCW3676250.1 hypothetical protein [Burkholderia cenocepacia]
MEFAYRHKDVFHRDGKGFLIEVSRHTSPVMHEFDSEGPNRWCVYAYIYPSHPHFASFSGPNIWQDATTVLPLHGGCTLLEYPMYDGKVTSVKVGADYHHLHDTRFTHYATADEARLVFEDADELFDKLQSMAAPEPVRVVTIAGVRDE